MFNWIAGKNDENQYILLFFSELSTKKMVKIIKSKDFFSELPKNYEIQEIKGFRFSLFPVLKLFLSFLVVVALFYWSSSCTVFWRSEGTLSETVLHQKIPYRAPLLNARTSHLTLPLSFIESATSPVLTSSNLLLFVVRCILCIAVVVLDSFSLINVIQKIFFRENSTVFYVTFFFNLFFFFFVDFPPKPIGRLFFPYWISHQN